MTYSEGKIALEKSRIHEMFRNASLINIFISILWTLVIILPFEPFTILLRIIVGGGPGVWFLLAEGHGIQAT